MQPIIGNRFVVPDLNDVELPTILSPRTTRPQGIKPIEPDSILRRLWWRPSTPLTPLVSPLAASPVTPDSIEPERPHWLELPDAPWAQFAGGLWMGAGPAPAAPQPPSYDSDATEIEPVTPPATHGVPDAGHVAQQRASKAPPPTPARGVIKRRGRPPRSHTYPDQPWRLMMSQFPAAAPMTRTPK